MVIYKEDWLEGGVDPQQVEDLITTITEIREAFANCTNSVEKAARERVERSTPQQPAADQRVVKRKIAANDIQPFPKKEEGYYPWRKAVLGMRDGGLYDPDELFLAVQTRVGSDSDALEIAQHIVAAADNWDQMIADLDAQVGEFHVQRGHLQEQFDKMTAIDQHGNGVNRLAADLSDICLREKPMSEAKGLSSVLMSENNWSSLMKKVGRQHMLLFGAKHPDWELAPLNEKWKWMIDYLMVTQRQLRACGATKQEEEERAAKTAGTKVTVKAVTAAPSPSAQRPLRCFFCEGEHPVHRCEELQRRRLAGTAVGDASQRSLCVRCVKPVHMCVKGACEGFHVYKDTGKKIVTDCPSCKVEDKPVNSMLCMCNVASIKKVGTVRITTVPLYERVRVLTEEGVVEIGCQYDQGASHTCVDRRLKPLLQVYPMDVAEEMLSWNGETTTVSEIAEIKLASTGQSIKGLIGGNILGVGRTAVMVPREWSEFFPNDQLQTEGEGTVDLLLGNEHSRYFPIQEAILDVGEEHALILYRSRITGKFLISGSSPQHILKGGSSPAVIKTVSISCTLAHQAFMEQCVIDEVNVEPQTMIRELNKAGRDGQSVDSVISGGTDAGDHDLDELERQMENADVGDRSAWGGNQEEEGGRIHRLPINYATSTESGVEPVQVVLGRACRDSEGECYDDTQAQVSRDVGDTGAGERRTSCSLDQERGESFEGGGRISPAGYPRILGSD